MQPFFDTPPKLTVSVTASCNLDCKHCYADCTREPRAAEMSTAEWLDFFGYLARNGFIQVYIEGGEPLYKADFSRLLEFSCKHMMTLVRTNGTLLTPAVAREWKRLGVGRAFVDLMGATATTHDWFAGVAGSFEKACSAVANLKRAGVPVDATVIVNRRNAAELNAQLRLARRLGAERVGILRLYPLGRVKHRWSELSLSLHEQDAAIASLRVPRGLRVMQSWHPKDSNCCWQAAAVDPFGNSIGCMYLREYVRYGNVRSTSLLHTWRNHPLYRQLRSGHVEQGCAGCSSADGTRGGCRASAFAFHGRWSAPDPFCTQLNAGVDLRVLPERLLYQNEGRQDAGIAGERRVARLHTQTTEPVHPESRDVRDPSACGRQSGLRDRSALFEAERDR